MELSNADLKMLELAWIPADLAERAGLYRVDSREGALLVGRNGAGDYGGLAFPYFLPGSAEPREYRLRRDNPPVEVKADGRRIEKGKYLSPPGAGNLLYFTPETTTGQLADIGLPLVITEGEKKALALARLADYDADDPRFLPVALSGVWNWRGKTGREPGPDGARRETRGPIPDLALVQWQNRRITLIFDSDQRRNADIRRAQRELAAELESRGAVCYVVTLPDLGGLEKTGADDYLAHPDGGPDRLLELIEMAARARPATVTEILAECGLADLSADTPLERIEDALRRLADLVKGADSIRRRTVREAAIKALKGAGLQSPAGLVSAALDLVADESAPAAGIEIKEPEPWSMPVDGAKLLEELASAYLRYVVMPSHVDRLLALWTVHTHALDAANISPILLITSPEKRCGKSLLLDVLGHLCRKPLLASNISAAALYRAVSKYKPTLLVDEADTFLKDNDELRGVLNAGHRRSTAFAVRCSGDESEPTIFVTWSAKAIAGIGSQADTLEDRSIIVQLARRTPTDEINRFRFDAVRAELEPLMRQAARWAKDNLAKLRESDPPTPPELSDRAADNWRPLLAIADAAGRFWPDLAREAAVALVPGEESEQSARVQLIKDIRDIFERKQTDTLTNFEIVDELVTMDERPWPEWRKDRPLTKRQLARLLGAFGIKPHQTRDGLKNVRLYHKEDFEEAWKRYAP